jgi:hypothetical protein
MAPNLRWWLIFVCIAAGVAFAAASGHVAAMWRIDAYKLSFVTLVTYFLMTVFIGRLTWRISRGDQAWYLRYQEGYDYSVTLMTMLGLIGPVEACRRNCDRVPGKSCHLRVTTCGCSSPHREGRGCEVATAIPSASELACDLKNRFDDPGGAEAPAHVVSLVGCAATSLAAHAATSWAPMAAAQWALCGAGLCATMVLIEALIRDPEGIERALTCAAVASATPVLACCYAYTLS